MSITGKPVDVCNLVRSPTHGCERKVGEAVLAGDGQVARSENVCDWLGHGAYLWENSPRRALGWARFLTQRPPVTKRKIRDPFVIGAVIDLGNCLDLTDAASREMIRAGYDEFERAMNKLVRRFQSTSLRTVAISIS